MPKRFGKKWGLIMTDDIVTRLREHVRGDFEKTSEFMLGLAADEIERLREDRDKWKRLFLEMYEKDGTTNEMMYAYRKEKW